MIEDTFANRLKQAIRLRNMKPAKLVELTGIDKSQISHWLAGDYKAKQDSLYILAKALNVNEAWLMGYKVSIERIPDEQRGQKELDEKEQFRKLLISKGYIKEKEDLSDEMFEKFLNIIETLLK